ncbi:hypothetical protein AOQ84DRAFT_421545 [Glonium stellatum]|uniref:Uncharacterized protein n=1 Tax=Glonium stellatum TaxID=574774 RepID=A0A8E2ER41_9PEZI|nr:hypothetical protein AOQ84DRAFT_421545 [Glonium stellatum]
MNKVPAADPQTRIGSLVFNPGGPGGVVTTSNDEYAALGGWSPELRNHFDIIGLDPRGIGSSNPINCGPEIWNERKMVAHNKAVGESCSNLTGPLFSHVDTTSAARDIEALGLALGEDKLNFLDFSYGTQLGAVYAELFLENIWAMALDGNLDHSGAETYSLTTESPTYETTADCALQGKDVGKLVDDLVKKADETPIPASECAASKQCRADVNGEEIRFNMQGFLTFKDPIPGAPQLSLWSNLSIAIAGAIDGDASGLSTPLAQSTNDALFGGLAVECLDWTHASKALSDVVYKEQLRSTFTPHTQGACQTWTIQTSSIGWPAPVRNPPHSVNVYGAPPILIINVKYDPLTYVWANNILEQIDGVVLLTRDGGGHTSYILKGETAAAIDSYLVNGTLPAPNTILKT